MSLPHTLGGIIGFAVMLMFLVSIGNNDESVLTNLNGFGEGMQNSLNMTQQFGVIGTVAGLTLSAGNLISLIGNLFLQIPSIISNSPPELQLIYVFMILNLIIALTKLGAGVWDY